MHVDYLNERRTCRPGLVMRVDALGALLCTIHSSTGPTHTPTPLTDDQPWRLLSMETWERQRRGFRLLVRGHPVTSTDGTLKVNSAPSCGRKLHQHKSPAADKTTTMTSVDADWLCWLYNYGCWAQPPRILNCWLWTTRKFSKADKPAR